MGETEIKYYYCVFWYPTIFHTKKELIEETIQKNNNRYYDISDRDNENLYLNVKYNIDDNSLIYTIAKLNSSDDSTVIDKDCDINDKIVCNFYYSSETERNGFVVYKYDRDYLKNQLFKWFNLGDEDLNDRLDKILISFYHKAKEFYHEHEVQHDSDARLEAYHYKLSNGNAKKYITEEPNVNKANNDAINWFIDQYEKQFSKYANDISKDLKMFESTLRDFESDNRVVILETNKAIVDIDDDNLTDCPAISINIADDGSDLKIPKKKNYNSEKKRVMLLKQTCLTALMEYNYCKSLIESIYNIDYKHNNDLCGTCYDVGNIVSIINKEQNICRKKAFNIRNSIRYIENVRLKCDEYSYKIEHALISDVNTTSSELENLTKDIKDLSVKNTDNTSKIESISKEIKGLATEISNSTYEIEKSGNIALFLGLVSLVITICQSKDNTIKLIFSIVLIVVGLIVYFFAINAKKKK